MWREKSHCFHVPVCPHTPVSTCITWNERRKPSSFSGIVSFQWRSRSSLLATWLDVFYTRGSYYTLENRLAQDFLFKGGSWNPSSQLEKEGCSPLPGGQQALQYGLSLLGLTQGPLIFLLKCRNVLDGAASVSDLLGTGWESGHWAVQWLQSLTKILTRGQRSVVKVRHWETRPAFFCETHAHPSFSLSRPQWHVKKMSACRFPARHSEGEEEVTSRMQKSKLKMETVPQIKLYCCISE